MTTHNFVRNIISVAIRVILGGRDVWNERRPWCVDEINEATVEWITIIEH